MKYDDIAGFINEILTVKFHVEPTKLKPFRYKKHIKFLFLMVFNA